MGSEPDRCGKFASDELRTPAALSLESSAVTAAAQWFLTLCFQGESGITLVAAEEGQRKACRVMSSRRDGDRSFLEAHYLFVNGANVRYATERHELRLLSRERWFDLFRSADLQVEYLSEGLTSHGLYIARGPR